jgi:hypothetical protein
MMTTFEEVPECFPSAALFYIAASRGQGSDFSNPCQHFALQFYFEKKY